MTFMLLGLGLALGLLARRLRVLPTATADWINGFIINIALPAMILLRVPAIELNRDALVPVAMAWAVIGASALAALWLGRKLKWPREVLGAMLLVVPLSNSAYLGLPLIDALADPQVLPYAILYDQIGNFMGVAIYASIIVVLYSAQSESVTATSIAKRILLFPPFLASVVALLLPPDAVPDIALPALGLLAAAMGPLAMLIVGLQLELSVPPALRRALVAGCGLKLVAAPLLVIALALAFGLRGPAVAGSVAQAAMPPMITAGMIGIAAGFSRPLILALTGVASVLSVVTLPAVFYIARVLGH